MAKINGIEVKSVKSYVGHEGLCYQGNVYKNGKKLGFWSQDGHGGPDDFDFDESLLDEACSNFKEGFPDDYPYKEFSDSKEVFMHELVELKNTEKDCNKEFKKGYPAIYYMTDGYHYTWLALPKDLTLEEVKTTYPTQVEQMSSQMFKNGYFECIYRPGEFDITVDKSHPAPALFMR